MPVDVDAAGAARRRHIRMFIGNRLENLSIDFRFRRSRRTGRGAGRRVT